MTLRSDNEIRAAEDFARQQRKGFAPLLQIDTSKGDAETCRQVQLAAAGDSYKFDAILAHPKVGALFNSGAIYYGRMA